MKGCFAYRGMEMFGFTKEYECGVIYRVSCWLGALGIDHKIEPELKKCLMNTQEKCAGDIILKL